MAMTYGEYFMPAIRFRKPAIVYDEDMMDYWAKPEYYSTLVKYDGYGDCQEFLENYEAGVANLPHKNDSNLLHRTYNRNH